MRGGGGVIKLGVGAVPAFLVALVSGAAPCLNGFSAACIFPPVLQAKLDVNLFAFTLHLGHVIDLSASLKESLNSNSVLHWGQKYSYIGIWSSLRSANVKIWNSSLIQLL
jgi:hypothetical protein